VTTKPFIVFTSNMFAVMGLRSLYFVLAGALGHFRYLKGGLCVVLVFIGVKMLIDPYDRPPQWFQYDIPDGVALGVVAGILALSVILSILVPGGKKGKGKKP
jgi:tellurite resistance protein TerC